MQVQEKIDSSMSHLVEVKKKYAPVTWSGASKISFWPKMSMNCVAILQGGGSIESHSFLNGAHWKRQCLSKILWYIVQDWDRQGKRLYHKISHLGHSVVTFDWCKTGNSHFVISIG